MSMKWRTASVLQREVTTTSRWELLRNRSFLPTAHPDGSRAARRDRERRERKLARRGHPVDEGNLDAEARARHEADARQRAYVYDGVKRVLDGGHARPPIMVSRLVYDLLATTDLADKVEVSTYDPEAYPSRPAYPSRRR